MTGRDAAHAAAGGRVLRWLPVLLVLAVLAAGLASYRFDLGARWFGLGDADPSTDPAAVAPPDGLTLPRLRPPAPVASPLAGPAASDGLDPAKVRRALAAGLRDPALGRDVFAWVSPLGEDAPVLARGAGAGIPASTTKLLTTTAALAALGPEHRFRTSVVSAGRGRVVLVGGGDPFLAGAPDPTAYPARADVATLAGATAEELRAAGIRRVRVGYDDALFTGPAVNPHWPADYVPDAVVAPITALWVDEGRPAGGVGRVADPSASAATVFAGALARRGIDVVGLPRPRRAAPGATELARVTSAPLSAIVERVLLVSDNEATEVLARHVGLAASGDGSASAGTRAVLAELRALGVELTGAEVYDGSGLSRENRLTPRTLADVLQVAASRAHPELRSVLTGLPVAGFTGSLAYRFADAAPAGRGRVRAKTGTLTGVSSLAGVATDRDDHAMVFVLMADRVALADTLAARDALDELAAALGACHCGR